MIQLYSAAEMERMKLQDVLLKAMAKRITWLEAPELTIPLPDGRSVKIGDHHGKVVVVAFILTT